MISTTYRKYLIYGSVLTGIVILITMPDVLMGLLFELVHFFFELVFISFEWLETLFDNIVEHLFHTELHQTQTIVFYLLVAIALFPLYYLWRLLLRFYFRLKESSRAAQAAWTLYKTRAIFYWQDLSSIDKIKWIAIMVGVIYLASFIFM